ncbi:MAG: ribonuclease R, partial [Mesotoga sp.]
MKLSMKAIREFITSPEYTPTTLRGIAVKLGFSDKESRGLLKKYLMELVNSGEVIRDSKGRYISPGEKMVVGKIEFARRGM